MPEQVEWRAVEGYEGIYEVSNTGAVRSLYREYVDRNGLQKTRPGWDLKPYRNSGGRRKVTLMRRGHRRDEYVARLVAQAFVPNPERKPEVNHADGVCDNDRADNLEWATRAENLEHALENGLAFGGQVQRGEAHPAAKLTEESVSAMRQLAKTDRPSAIALGVAQGVTRSASRAAIDGRSWKHLPL